MRLTPDLILSAFDGFDYKKIAEYDEHKIDSLYNDSSIIKNKLKILAAKNNAKVYSELILEYKSFKNYLYTFWDGKIIYDNVSVSSKLSDALSKDLKKRGMKFFGTTIAHSFLQAIGVFNSHNNDCFLYKTEI